jgi:DNA-binding transcriptional LysR family regulator
MHLRNVKIFCDVAVCRSFSRAAELHGVSQPAISQAVQALEERLSTRLIDRSQRPLALTPAGQIYLEGVRDVLTSLEKLEQTVQEMENRVTGTVKVSAIYSIGLSRIDGYLKRFREMYPEAGIQAEYVHPNEVYEQVRTEAADLGLLSFPRDGGEFHCEPWQEQEICLIVPVGHPLADRERVSISEVEGEPLISFTEELPIRRNLDRWLKKTGISLTIAHEFDNIENIKRDVEIGGGIAFLPWETVERERELGFLRAIPLRDVSWTRPLGIVSKRKRRLSAAARKFIELLKADSTTKSKSLLSSEPISAAPRA